MRDRIENIDAFMVFDSRGWPTVEAVVELGSGIRGSGIVPAGASTGRFEAWEYRDGDVDYFQGKAVNNALQNIHEKIAPALRGTSVYGQTEIDQIMLELDGTANKSHLGANAILAVSMATCQAAARLKEIPLYQYLAFDQEPIIPLPEIQIYGGGAHSAGRIDLQDYMIICVGARDLTECYHMTFNVYQTARKRLLEQGLLQGVADEGGFWPAFNHNVEGLERLTEAIIQAGYQPGTDICISLDIAASEFYTDGVYQFKREGKSFSSDKFSDLLTRWCRNYAICSIEDPFSEDDKEAWKSFTHQQKDLQIIGDDLFVTNAELIKSGVRQGLANSVLIKLNQIGTVSETLDAIKLTLEAGWRPVVSARSGETEDTFIAHMAVATGAGQLKVGSFARSERMAKWNELLRIERSLSHKARFANDIIQFPWS